MGKIIFELLAPILLVLYLIVDILIPSFTTWKYFWFLKSFFKPTVKSSFEEELRDAEQSYEDAKTKMERLKNSATDEAKKAEKDLAKAKEILENSKKKIENFKK